MANPASFPLFPDVAGAAPEYPLTETARAIRAEWDPQRAGNPFLSCEPIGMPRIMGQPYPMEFVDDGERILLRIELYDVVRTIHMDPDAAAGNAPPGPLGFSTGSWDGNALVVRTTRLGWPWFDQSGIPQSAAAELLERFTPSADGTRLEYILTVTDPDTFTEPVTLEKYWTWRPDAQVRPFDCNPAYSP